MIEWQTLLRKVMRHGQRRNDRTGVGTLALFGETVTFDNRTTFPAVTTKRLGFEQMAAELACFLKGARSLEEFHKFGCTIWDGNGNAEYWKPRAEFEGDLGRIYGVQWRDWRSIGSAGWSSTDQLVNLLNGLVKEPHGRRHVVTALNPGELDQMCLPPCHLFFQCFVGSGGQLDMTVYMRSVDVFLGLPFDIASYALLQRLIVQTLGGGTKPGFLTFFLGDTHIYLNHLDQVATVLSRKACPGPQLHLDSAATVFDFHPSQASLQDYTHLGVVPAPLRHLGATMPETTKVHGLQSGQSFYFKERADVLCFQQKFNVPMASAPAFLDAKAFQFRLKFLQEELDEFARAHVAGDMHGAADALVDSAYVLHGTALMMGLPWPMLWDEVQRKNMQKERAAHAGESKRGSALDVIKPAGWTPPDHTAALGVGSVALFQDRGLT